ncbi:MAG: hypothetical protein LBU34_16180 [Planctomycetaceae bacterium]|jgi:hypothetical protein|nr:hypothetical protein [Planctomycetaceae bacterium]
MTNYRISQIQKLFFVIVCFSFLILLGCGSGSPFPVEAVEGTVTLDGQPVEDAVLTFVPVHSDNGKAAYGRTDVTGTYKLTAFNGGKSGAGTMVGHYIVSILKEVPVREPTAKELADQEEKGIEINIPMRSIVPAQYNDAQTSGLTAEIVKGKNIVHFDLQSDKK